MKTLTRILIIASFAAIIFIPNLYSNRLVIILMFFVMLSLVSLYWFAMFWVSKKDVEKVLGKKPDHDVYVGMLPAISTADLIRGRMCAVDGKLVLLKRTEDKEHRKTPCKEAWSVDMADVTSVGFGKVLPARKGFILYMGEDEASFTCAKVAKNKGLVYDLLGWKMPEEK